MPLASLSQTTRRRYAKILGALGAFMPCVYAQTAPTSTPTAEVASKTDAVLLTPFEVNTSQDRGFAGGNTLSGGRINTPLDLSPSSIQVITKEFIEDFGITDFLDAAKWTMNVDPPTGNNDAPFGTGRFEINVRSANGQGNIPMRDGIPQYSIADSYNSERFEVVSGPNSGMAGLGNSGGVTGSSSKKARFNNRTGSVSTRVDSFGGYRGTLDYNYGVDRVAFRLNALHQNEKTILEGTTKKMNAITLRADFKLTAKTILSAQYERSGEWNTQYRQTYGDQQSFWDRTTVNLNNSALPTPPTGQPGNGLARIAGGTNGANDRLTYNFATKSLINYTGNQYQTSGLNFQIPWKGNPYVPTEWFGGANMIRSFGKDFWLGPVDNFADRDISSKRVTIDHIFSPNLTARLVWQSHEGDPVTYWGDFSQPGDVRVDVNALLPNGAPNPNYMRRYAEWGAGGSQYQEDSRDVYNAEVSYSFRLPRLFDLKQNFSGIYSYLDGTYSAWTRTWRRNNNPAQPDPLNGVNALTFRTYYGDPQPRVQPIITQAALNALMPGTTWGNYGSGWHADSIKDGRNAAIYSTTSFLKDRLVISGNFRRDKIINADMNGINVNGRANDPLNNYKKYIGQVNPVTKLAEEGYSVKTNASLDSFGIGTVVSPFPARWAWLTPIKFVVNYSENYREPSPGGPFYTGQTPGAPFSSTVDYAVRFSIPGGKVYGEVRRYFTTNTGNIAGMSNQGDIQNIWRNLGFTSGGDTYDFSTNAYRDINDRDLTGTEIELVANPTNNWTLRANYAHPRVQTVSDRPYLSRYFAEHQAEWRAGALLPDGATVPGTNRVILSQAAIVQAITNIENGLNGLTPGTIGNGPLHRGTLATTYRFREGKLKGLGFSGGVSWRGSAKAGSRDARLKFKTTAPTVAQTKEAAYDYLYVPSQMTNNVGINYERRFGKYSARFQVNISNILNDDDPQWTGYGVINAGQLTNQNDGNALTVAGSNPRMQVLRDFFQQEPRKFVFTTTLNF